MTWRKSTFSETANCVEAADWRKSQHSSYAGQCVEVASGVAVRDTQDRDGVTLQFTAEAWQEFTRKLVS